MHAQREKFGFEVSALGRIKAGDEKGCVCECGKQWYLAWMSQLAQAVWGWYVALYCLG